MEQKKNWRTLKYLIEFFSNIRWNFQFYGLGRARSILKIGTALYLHDKIHEIEWQLGNFGKKIPIFSLSRGIINGLIRFGIVEGNRNRLIVNLEIIFALHKSVRRQLHKIKFKKSHIKFESGPYSLFSAFIFQSSAIFVRNGALEVQHQSCAFVLFR